VKPKYILRVIGLLALFVSFLPAHSADALVRTAIPPVDMFQLPWQQGEAWIALDGFDDGTKRPETSPHNYLNGGAVDFTPNKDVHIGVDTSNFWVTAAAAGKVVVISSCHIVINHGNGWLTEYQHLGNIQVVLGESVYRNQRLGVIHDNIGVQVCPGNVSPYPHLHFSLRPTMRNVTFAGWLLTYDPLQNKTVFSRNGQNIETWSYIPILNAPELQIVLREQITWDILYDGSVDTYRYERWPFTLTETQSFTLTATPTTSGLVPLLLLLDANGNEIARGTGTLNSTQPAGNYFVQVQPQAGEGFYNLLLQKIDLPEPTDPYVSTTVVPPSIEVGETALVTVSLGNVPPTGYASAEFTCTYNATLVRTSNIIVTNRFGTDSATAINDPQNGSFIVAIAGTNGNRATTSGPVFTFNVTGLQVGQTPIECQARVSSGDGVLSDLIAVNTTLTIVDAAPTSVPISASSFPVPAPEVYTVTSPVLTGQVLASKPVTVSLYNPDNSLAASAPVDANGNFSLEAPSGNYTVVAAASGFLNAQGPATLNAEETSTKATVNLLAGDIDGNSVIDQLDAMTIGMSYNMTSPEAADLNNDGVINVLDLQALASNYRASGALDWP
jgi:murein DD-endopeptidase MepM/ murein hydrolase activator NlpD